MSITRPNIVQQENRLRSLPDEALRAMLLQMGQTGQVGSPEYLLAAGEMQARKNVRQQAQMGQPQQPPVIAELLTGVPMPGGMPQGQPQPQQPMPAEAGVAALPAENLEALDQPQYAAGGIVAFQAGGTSRLSPEEIETNRLREQIRRRYAGMTSPLGAFTPVAAGDVPAFQEKRRGMQDVLGALPNLNRDQLEQLDISLRAMDQRPLATQQAQQTIAAETAPVSPGDLRRLEAAAGDPYVTQRPPVVAPPPPPKNKGIAALAAPPQPTSYDALMRQAGRFAGQIGPEAETAPTIQEAVAQQKQALQEAGFDFGLVKDQIAQIRAEKEQSASDRKEAVNLRLLEAGLGIMAGESPHAFVNIGKGAAPALKGLSDDIKEIKKIDRERDKAMRDLAVADNQIASGMGLAALKTRESAQERIARANESRAAREASIFGALTSAETQRYVADQGAVTARETRAASQLASRENTALKQAQDQIQKELVMNPTLASDPIAYNRRLTQLYNQNLSLLLGKESDTKDDLSGWGTPRVKKQ